MFEGTNPPAQKQTPWPILPVIFALYVIISAAAFYFLETQLVNLGDRMSASESALRDQIAQTHKELRSSASKLTQQVGDTEEKLSQRALELAAQERRTQQTAAQLADSQKQQAAQLETVSSNVSGVQS